MSHFTVLVTGDHEQALAPFHEFECTGENDEYVQDIDITGEAVDVEGLDHHGLEDKIVDDASKIDIHGEHKYGYAIVQDGVLVKAVRRTNPNCKWDWYTVGGRWSGMLKLKNDAGNVDTASAGDVDWEGMLAPAREEAGKSWDLITRLVAQHPAFIPFEEVKKKVEGDVVEGVTAKLTGEAIMDLVRNTYHEQAMLQALVEAHKDEPLFMHDFGDDIVEVQKFKEREAYVNYKAAASCRTYALLHQGQWLQPGEMGWFGMSDKTVDSEIEYTRKFWEIVLALDPHETVTVVDCHI
jgi:ribosomal silencing factor RsfS